MRLRRLTGLEREKIEEEYKELEERIAYLRSVLADEHKVMEIVKTELLDAKKKFGDNDVRKSLPTPLIFPSKT